MAPARKTGKSRPMRRALLPVVLGIAAVGCARPPRPLAGEFPPVSVRDAQRDPPTGTTVRWGGTLVRTTPTNDGRTCFEVVSRPLDRRARPTTSDESAGRFVACAPAFYDPDVYAPGREVTFVGTLDGTTTRPVGEVDYTFPVVDARVVHLWEPRPVYPASGPRFGISIGGVFGF